MPIGSSSASLSVNMTQDFSHLFPPGTLEKLARSFIDADVPYFDIGGYVVGEKSETAHLLGKSPGVLAGVPFANAVFAEMGVEVKWLKNEGDEITEEEAARKAPVAIITSANTASHVLPLCQMPSTNTRRDDEVK